MSAKKNKKKDEEKDELRRAITKSAVDFTIAHSGKILAIFGALFIYISDWVDEKRR